MFQTSLLQLWKCLHLLRQTHSEKSKSNCDIVWLNDEMTIKYLFLIDTWVPFLVDSIFVPPTPPTTTTMPPPVVPHFHWENIQWSKQDWPSRVKLCRSSCSPFGYWFTNMALCIGIEMRRNSQLSSQFSPPIHKTVKMLGALKDYF